MKNTGIIRRIDDLGRVVIPKEIRKTYCINEGDPLEIHMGNDMVGFKKYVAETNYISRISNIVETLFEDFDINDGIRSRLTDKLNEALELLGKE